MARPHLQPRFFPHLTDPDAEPRLGRVLQTAAYFLAALAVAAVLIGAVTNAFSLKWLGLMMIVAGSVEVAGGLPVLRAGARAMAFVLGGVLSLCVGLLLLTNLSTSPAGVGLMLALYFFINGLFRGIDVAIDRPRAWKWEGAYAFVAMLSGMVLFGTWRAATPRLLALLLAAELFSRAVSFWGIRRHPLEPDRRLNFTTPLNATTRKRP
jgi:uncharacterized membrane protein HdeD (DUF308 family)